MALVEDSRMSITQLKLMRDQLRGQNFKEKISELLENLDRQLLLVLRTKYPLSLLPLSPFHSLSTNSRPFFLFLTISSLKVTWFDRLSKILAHIRASIDSWWWLDTACEASTPNKMVPHALFFPSLFTSFFSFPPLLPSFLSPLL